MSSTLSAKEQTRHGAKRLRGFLIRERWQQFLEDSSFLRHYLWKYRKFAAIGLGALVMVDLLETIPPLFLKRAVDIAVVGGPMSQLAWLAGCYAAVAFLQALGRYAWRMYLIRASLLAGRDMRKKFSAHLFGLSASFFDRRPIGDLMSLATSDVEAVRMMLGHGLLVLADSLFYFLTVPVVMYWLSPELTLLAFLPLPIIPWLVLRNEREVHERFQKVQEGFSRLSALTQEALSGIRVTKAFAKEDAQLRRFRELGEEFIRLNLRLARVQSSFAPTLDFAMSLGMVALLYVGGRIIIREGSEVLTLGTFVAFQRYIQKMVWPMAALGMGLSTYQRAKTSSERLKGVLSRETDVKDPGEQPWAKASGFKTPGAVEFRELSFAFPGTRNQILNGISIRIEPGERVAFIGTIGSGKSALLSLLPRLYPVAPGMLFIDGVDINQWPLEELRRQVGYVSQEVFLFSESVLENVAYGLHDWSTGWLDREIETSSVEEAVRLASLNEDIERLRGSYRTRLGERGVNLSGGQKQRLTIARAIVKKPSILVLDDALSSVDVQTEDRILKGLRERPGRNTEVIAAHRISTILDADRIVVLERGQILQQGSHRELLKDTCPVYRKFYEQQQLKEDLENYSRELDPIASGAPSARMMEPATPTPEGVSP